MYKPIIKTKTAYNSCYNDTVIVIPQLDDNSAKTPVCSFAKIFCIGSIAFCAVAGMYILFNNLSTDELNSVMNMNTMGDIDYDTINGYIA